MGSGKYVESVEKVEKQGETLPQQGEKQESVPRTPNERDESATSQAATESSGQAIGKAAHADIERGAVDTDKGPAMDRTYDKVKKG